MILYYIICVDSSKTYGYDNDQERKADIIMKVFEFLGGLMFWICTIQFIINPKAALEETYRVLTTSSPRITGGHLQLPRGKHRKISNHDVALD